MFALGDDKLTKYQWCSTLSFWLSDEHGERKYASSRVYVKHVRCRKLRKTIYKRKFSSQIFGCVYDKRDILSFHEMYHHQLAQSVCDIFPWNFLLLVRPPSAPSSITSRMWSLYGMFQGITHTFGGYETQKCWTYWTLQSFSDEFGCGYAYGVFSFWMPQ